MALESGTRLGHYEVTDMLGKGGMGEVYRARDTKLGREVAIKVLPSEFSKDEERLARLEREARMLASLNHPNIAAIHGLEESDGTRFLVLELVEGDTLADQIRRGAIPVEESLKLALQIAEGLEAAHEKGVIHRDLKPANIKVTPDGKVKVLDFGLAKAFIGDQADVNLSNSPTLSMQATQAGMILGTAAYMSPEQAGGETADTRTDTWSFGVVLFEMLTGRQLFKGKNVTHILADVVRTEPRWDDLPANLNPRLRLLLEGCLEKEPKDRLSGISDARVSIQKVLADPGALVLSPATEVTQGGTRPKLAWVTAVVVAAIAGAVLWGLVSRPAEPPGTLLTRFTVNTPADGPVVTTYGWRVVTISPDGRMIAYASAPTGPPSRQIYVRRIDELEATVLRGTESNGSAPFFSHDSAMIGFTGDAGQALKTVSVLGGPPTTIASFDAQPFGMDWGNDGYILFSLVSRPGLLRIPAVGGDVQQVTAPDSEAGETGHSHGTLLPDGDTILFTISYGTARDSELARVSLVSREVTHLQISGSDPQYSPTGHIVYAVSDGTMRAVPFNLDRLEILSTSPTPVVENLHTGASNLGIATGNFGLAANGTLVYLDGVSPGNAGAQETTLVWVDRNGNETPLSLPPDEYTRARISPDGTQVALQIGAPADIWIYDLETLNPRRLTFDAAANDTYPVWGPDGDQIFFSSDQDGSLAVYVMSPEGGDARRVATATDFRPLPWSTSPDGETLAAVALYSPTQTAIVSYQVDSEDAVTMLLNDDTGLVFNEPVISPNGEWVAYFEGELTTPEINVRPFPDVGRIQVPVSQSFGMGPAWSADGSELFYTNGSGIWAAPVEYNPFRIGTPEELFSRQYRYGGLGAQGQGGRAWDVDPNGERFLMVNVPGSTPGDAEVDTAEIVVVENWFEELKERVPVP